MALDPFVALARQRAALDIADAGAAQPRAARSSRQADDVAGDELAAVVHRRGERQGLAAGAGAEIDDPHAGPRIGEQRGDLRALVLHLDEPVLEGGEAGRAARAREAQAERRERRRLGLDALGGERARAPLRGRPSAG